MIEFHDSRCNQAVVLEDDAFTEERNVVMEILTGDVNSELGGYVGILFIRYTMERDSRSLKAADATVGVHNRETRVICMALRNINYATPGRDEFVCRTPVHRTRCDCMGERATVYFPKPRADRIRTCV